MSSFLFQTMIKFVLRKVDVLALIKNWFWRKMLKFVLHKQTMNNCYVVFKFKFFYWKKDLNRLTFAKIKNKIYFLFISYWNHQ
jgi:hypothetical protein